MADDQQILLSDILTVLKRRRYVVLGSIAVCMALGVLYAVLATPLYTASTTIQPAPASRQLGGLAGQFGAAAALVGINVGGGNESVEYLEVLKSRELAENFIVEHQLMPHLFPERWDGEQGKWKKRGTGVWSAASDGLARLVANISGDAGWQERHDAEPTMWEAYKRFNDNIRTVQEDRQTGVVTLSFTLPDPVLAASWTDNYVALANRKIREKSVAEAQRALAYLDIEVQKASTANLRDTIAKLAEAQLETIVLANAREQFAFEVIDSAAIPEDRAHPKRGFVMVLMTVVGCAFGVLIAFMLETLGRASHQNSPGLRIDDKPTNEAASFHG